MRDHSIKGRQRAKARRRRPRRGKPRGRHFRSNNSRSRGTGGLISAFLLVLFCFYFFVPPRISITQGGLLHACEKQVVIRNSGFFPIEVKTRFELHGVKEAGGSTGRFDPLDSNISRLEVDQDYQVDISALMRDNPRLFASGIVSVTTEARNLVLPYTRVKTRNFQIERSREGGYLISEFPPACHEHDQAHKK